MSFFKYSPAASSSSPFTSFSSQQLQQQQQQQLQLQQQQQQQLQLQQQQQQQQQQQGIHLFSSDGSPLSYQAKWSDVHPDSQRLLLDIEVRILEYRDESRRLDQCQRLYDSSALHRGFESDAARISQELSGIAAAVDREHSSLQDLMQVAKQLIRNAEVAVRSFTMLRHRLSRPSVAAVSNAPTTTPAPASLLFSGGLSPAVPAPSQAPSPAVDFYSGIPVKPSPFLQQIVARFQYQLTEYRQRIEELERLLLAGADKENTTTGSDYTVLQSLPTVMSNVHDFFIHVAAEVESLHQQLGALRTAFLVDRRRRGDDSDPFLEADRREAAKQEAAARRIHPTLIASSMVQSSAQLTTVAAPAAPALFGATTPSTAFAGFSSASFPGASTGGFGSSPSIFGTPSTPAQTQSLFGAPAQTTFPTFGASPATPAPASTPFGSTTPSMFGATTGSMFGSTSTPLFGAATPAFGTPTTPVFSGASTPGNIFGASPSPAASPSPFGASTGGGLFGGTPGLFGTPSPAFGANIGTPVFGSGLTTTTAAAKPKPRGARRK